MPLRDVRAGDQTGLVAVRITTALGAQLLAGWQAERVVAHCLETTPALQSALQMAASQGCWARGLDGPWACGREDLSSGSSRAWLAGLDPCVAVQRAAKCILELQLQMQYQPAGRRSMARSSEMCTVRRRGGGHGHGYMPLCPASQQRTYIHTDVQTTAADAPPALLGTPGTHA